MSNDDFSIEQRLDDQKHLAELETFLNSRVHKGYKAARTQEIADVKDAILMNDPIDRASEIEGFKMRGELRGLEELLTTFEDTRQTLKTRIEQALELENKMASEKKV